jgi:hypothetical protein
MPGEEETKGSAKNETELNNNNNNTRTGYGRRPNRNNNFYRDGATREFHNGGGGNGYRYNPRRNNMPRFGAFRGRGLHFGQGIFYILFIRNYNLILQAIDNIMAMV